MSRKYDGGAPGDYLPARLPHILRRETARVTAFGGGATPFGGGDIIAEGRNLSPRQKPLLATRKPRGLFTHGRGSGAPHGMIWFDGILIFARGSGLFATSDGVTVHTLGTVSDTDKSFFIFGDCLYIYPDKLFLKSGNIMPKPIELDTGVIEQAEFKGNTVTLPKGYIWSDLGFAEGDCLRVLNADDVTPAPEGYYRLERLRAGVATLANTSLSTYTSNARFLRVVPDLTRCCVNGDRVYGIAGKDIYISAAGSATDFYSRASADGKYPVLLHSATDGDFTALSPWQGYMVFFKSDRICKLLGSRSDSFTLHDNSGVGIPAGLSDTLCEVENALYYASHGGVYRYRGQEPERISSLNGVTVSHGCGGTDGCAYYLAVTADGAANGEGALSLLLPDREEWYPEDGVTVGAMLRRDGFLFMQDGEGRIWKTSSDGRATGCNFDERQVIGAVTASAVLVSDHFGEPDGYRLSGLAIRATGEVGGTLRVLARYDEHSDEVLLGTYTGKMTDRLLRVPVMPCPCDGMVLRLEAVGDWVIHAVISEYERRGQ